MAGFSSIQAVLRWYAENYLCLQGARSLHLSIDKVFAYKGNRNFALTKLDLLVTIAYYISKLSKTGRLILKRLYLENMSYRDIAKLLNEQQNTRNYSSKRVEKIYWNNLKRLENHLMKAEVIKNDV